MRIDEARNATRRSSRSVAVSLPLDRVHDDRRDANVQRAQALDVAPRLGVDHRLGARDDDGRDAIARRPARLRKRSIARAHLVEKIVGAIARGSDA